MALKIESEAAIRKHVASLKNELNNEGLKTVLMAYWMPWAGLTVSVETFEEMTVECAMLIVKNCAEMSGSMENIRQRMY